MSKQIGIIADDLTGANDSGVQLAKKGLSSTVVLNYRKENITSHSDVLIIDTDSRGKTEKDAFEAVSQAASLLFKEKCQHVYKKVDSTLRGNIGAEVSALEQAFQPELIVFAPAFPRMNRRTIQGYHYVNGTLISETEFGKDPKTPVTESYIPDLLKKYANDKTVLIDTERLRDEENCLIKFIEDSLEKGHRWMVCDSESEADLQKIADVFSKIDKRMVWVGSAGLIEYLPDALPLHFSDSNQDEDFKINKTLIVSGSLSKVTRSQLLLVNELQDSFLLELDPKQLVRKSFDIESILLQIRQLTNNHYIVLYVDSSERNRVGAKEVGETLGLTLTEVSEAISEGLGKISEAILEQFPSINGLVLTGGDTAKAVCEKLGMAEMELRSEIEPGLPFGQLRSENKKYWAVTKAGGFGTEDSLVNALKYMTRKVEHHDTK